MNLHVIHTGLFKLDGGAMFGVVPKAIWQKFVPADENNLCTWAMRCLLVEDGNKLILIDNGIGDKQDAKFFSYYYLQGDQNLIDSIKKAGFSPNDVTDVIMTHLHFDHCGGGVKHNDSKTKLELTFPNATYWSSEAHWQWATKPNAREKASFLTENILPIQESGHLKFIDPNLPSPFKNIDFFFANGHTEAQMLPKIKYKDKTVIFVADLIPSYAHIPIPYVMGYDTRPLLSMEEKSRLLEDAAKENHILFFEHDAQHECCTVKSTEKGVRLEQVLTVKDL